MDPTSLFFSRLRRLAVTLETETESLQDAYQTRDDHDSSVTDRGMGAYHTLCNELSDLKGEMRVRLEQQLSREAEVKSYLAACGVMQRRISDDVHTLKGHYETYGYQAPPNTHAQVKGHIPESADLGTEEGSASVKEGEEEEGEEDGATERKDPQLPSTPQSAQPPIGDALRTPKLADFGLSELDLKRMLRGDPGCPKSPPMPVLSVPLLQSSLATPLPPALLPTPKCASRTEQEELPTLQLKDFAISERALHPDSDSTMAPPPTTFQMRMPQLSDFGLSEADLQRIGAMGFHEAPPMPALSFTSPQLSQAPPLALSLSPDIPLTPRRALHMEMEEEEEEEEELRMPQMKDFGIVEHTLCLNDFTMDLHRMAMRSSNPPHHQQPPPEREYLTPEMPKMESVFCNTLLKRSAHGACESGDPSSPDVDGPTQEFNLRTPRVRLAYQDPSTPEMPDLSSITQDICKLVSCAELKEKNTAVVMPTPRGLGKENGAVLLPPVADSEFHSLPNYLRQMSLTSLNDAIHKINTAATAKHQQGEALQFLTEELKSLTGVGTKAPIYFLCLEELHRLKHVQRVGKGSVYKLLPQH